MYSGSRLRVHTLPYYSYCTNCTPIHRDIPCRTTGNVHELIGLGKSIENRNIIILEDIIDTGITLEKIISLLKKENVADIKIATLLFKPEAYTKDIPIDFIGKSITNDFVVGYGLDYDELGRNLQHIYKLKE